MRQMLHNFAEAMLLITLIMGGIGYGILLCYALIKAGSRLLKRFEDK